MAQHAESFSTVRPRLACYEQSVAVSVPANLVQDDWLNRVDGRPALSPEVLARRFDYGDRLDLTRYSGLVTNGCHQELEYIFERHASIPTVSVVIPCFNQARYLPDAIASIRQQTFADWEIVVIDDGSSDDTQEVAARLTRELGPQARVIRQANAGLPAARNAGIARARGRYILPLDADDMLHPTMLERTVASLERDLSVAIAYTDLQQFGESFEIVHALEFDPLRLAESNHLNYCALYRREVWDAVGGYNRNMTWGYEDWDFWIGAAEKGYQAVRISAPLLLYRVRAGSMYSAALKHDSELRKQIRLNHPATYRPVERVLRRIRLAGRQRSARLRIWLASAMRH
jgi:glycosyltransferase involved in cell wall biosynthesis